MRTRVYLIFILSLLSTARRTSNAQEESSSATPAAYYYVPNWTPGISHRHNFCQQHAAVEKGDVELRNALSGLNVSVGFFRYQLNENTGVISAEQANQNIAVEFMDEIARRAGFEYRNTYGVLDLIDGNETWSDFLYFATDVYDVIGDYFDETTRRLERNILYPDGWYDGNYIMVMKSDNENNNAIWSNLFSFTAPLTPQVWGLIFLTTVVSGFVYYFLDYVDSRIKRRPMDVGLESSVFLTAFLFKGHFGHNPKSRGTRILIFSMAFFFLLIVACYTANLASFLVLKNRRVVINDIQDVIRNDFVFCVERGTAFDEYLQTFRIQPRQLVRTVVTDGVDLEASPLVALQEGRCDIVLTSKQSYEIFRRSEQYNPDCNLEFVGRIQKIVSAGFSLKDSEQYCSSLLRDVLNLHMMEIKDDGIYDMIWDTYLEKAATSSCAISGSSGSDGESGGDDNDSLGLADLSGVFALHALGLTMALAFTWFQFFRQPKHRKKAMITEITKGMLGGTSLNRAVIDASHNESTAFSLGKNRQTTSNRACDPRVAIAPLPKKRPSTVEEFSDEDEVSSEEEEMRKKAVGTGRVRRKRKEVVDLAEIKEHFAAVMEQNKEQKLLIEQLLEQSQRMEMRVQKIDQRVSNMEEIIMLSCLDKPNGL